MTYDVSSNYSTMSLLIVVVVIATQENRHSTVSIGEHSIEHYQLVSL